MRWIVAIALVLLVPQQGAMARSHDSCAWLHGRMTFGNGSPWVRIWPHGTHRLLGVVNWQNEPEGDKIVPMAVGNMWLAHQDSDIWGDFRVCPMEPDRKGYMRRVKVTAARHYFAVQR